MVMIQTFPWFGGVVSWGENGVKRGIFFASPALFGGLQVGRVFNTGFVLSACEATADETLELLNCSYAPKADMS
jgi:hypothetical protein